ncbi:MAG: type I glyceraldehyde-3-phosphate dehydrogenase [Bacteriovoracaceae bacterium]|nr:type I glyceraldehyde-3-phosphate dehydrogenase [Bacteriovoracaceae bacterium]
MAKIRVGLNGMGRIGRTLLREYLKHYQKSDTAFEIVAVNNPGDLETYLHLLKYDSVHGKIPGELKILPSNDGFQLGGQSIKFFVNPNPKEIPWKEVGAQIVIDATGRFKDIDSLSGHLNNDITKKVIMCAPGKKLHGTFVYGINHQTFDPAKHHVISNASCTTNCLAPVAQILDEALGIENGFMTTVHAYTNDQNLLDNSHDDLRRARAASLSMIPTSTGAAKAIGEVLPSLAGKLDGFSVRVPTPDVSMVDLTVTVRKSATKQEINELFRVASETKLKGILKFTTEELVSIDYLGTRESAVFDSTLTNVIGKTVKVIAWYDNEVGFSNRVLDLASHVGATTWR